MRLFKPTVVFLLFWAATVTPPGPARSSAQSPTAHPVGQDALRQLEFVGQIGGTTSAIALSGTSLVLNVGPRLVVVDVANRAQPRVLGQSDLLPGALKDITLSWPYAYAAAGPFGLLVFDLSNPAVPRLAATLANERVDEVIVSGAMLYTFGQDRGLLVFDLGVPTDPVRVGGASVQRTGSAPSRMALDWPYLYVAAGRQGLLVYDVSNPWAPTRSGRFLTETRDPMKRDTREAGSVALIDGYAYVGWVRPNSTSMYYVAGVSVVDKSQGSELTEVAFIQLRAGPRVSAYDGYLYALSSGTNASRLVIYDVSEPSLPQVAYEAQNIDAVVAKNGTLYGVDDGVVKVMEVASPGGPVDLGSTGTVGQPWNIVLDGTFVYTAGPRAGSQLLDASLPSRLRVVRNLPGEVKRVAIDSEHLYLRGAMSLVVLKRNGTADPPAVSTIENMPLPRDYGTEGFRWPYMYTLSGSSMSIWDLSSEAGAPIAEARTLVSGRAKSLVVSPSGRRVYVTSDDSVAIVDVTDPRRPSVDRRLSFENLNKIVATDTHLYAGIGSTIPDEGRRGLSIWDVTNPGRARETTFIPMTGRSVLPTLSSGRLLTRPGFGSQDPVHVFDLSDPSHPRDRSFELPPFTQGAFEWVVQDDLVFVATGRDGIVVYRIPQEP
jgi:hypothetical protein